MANTVIALRSSGVASNTPSLGVLSNGELSINFADGILYYKSSSNTLGSIRTTVVSGLTTEVQFNDAGVFGANANFTFNKTIATLNVTNINVSTNLTATSITTGSGVGGIIAGANVIYSNIFVANSTTTSISNATGAIISNGGLGVKGNVYADAVYDGGVEVILFANQAFNQANSANVLAQAAYNQANTALSNTNLNVSGTLRALNQGGDEGGELFLDKPVTNTSLSAGITIDVFQNKLRIFETGGSVRGVFIDIANSAAGGVGTDLLNPTSTPDIVARVTANAAFDKANSANVLAQAAFNQANVSPSWVSKTTNYTAINGDKLIANTAGGVFTITLPASPSTGHFVEIADGADWSTNNLTVARNASTIEGLAEDLTVDVSGIQLELVYDGTTWEVYAVATSVNTNIGFKNIPAVGTKTTSYTLATADVGKYVQVGTGGSVTIPDAVFAEGDVVSIFNNTTGAITITCTITTAYIAGTDADQATVSLATRGTATILFISGTVCVIAGNVS